MLLKKLDLSHLYLDKRLEFVVNPRYAQFYFMLYLESSITNLPYLFLSLIELEYEMSGFHISKYIKNYTIHLWFKVPHILKLRYGLMAKIRCFHNRKRKIYNREKSCSIYIVLGKFDNFPFFKKI